MLFLERRPVKPGKQQIRIVTRQKPAFPGVDPYNKHVDRNSDDNVVDVTEASPAGHDGAATCRTPPASRQRRAQRPFMMRAPSGEKRGIPRKQGVPVKTARTASAALLLWSVPATAAETPVPDQEAPAPATTQPAQPVTEVSEEIIVTAGRPKSSVVSDIQAEVTLSPADIRAYGASSLADLLQQLSPQTRSGRGRGGDAPIVLINGRRVSGFAEIRNIPPEAIQRVDVLPEETALSYGFRADQRVVNFILRDQFAAFTGEVELGGPTAGNRRERELQASIIRIDGDARVLIDAQVLSGSALLESDRNIDQGTADPPRAVGGNILALTPGAEIDPALSALAGTPVTAAAVPQSAATRAPGLADFAATANQPAITDQGLFRTLIPETHDVSGGASIARPIAEKVQLTLSARAGTSSSEARLGLPATDLILPAGNPFSPFATDTRLAGLALAPGPLLSDRDSWNGRLAAVLNGDIRGWRWSLNASHDHEQAVTLTDRSIDLALFQARLDANDPGTNPFAPAAINGPRVLDRAASNSDRTLVEAVANGRLAELPAGGLATTLSLAFDERDFESSTTSNGFGIQADLGRTQAGGQISVDFPISSTRRQVLAAIGDLSVNANAGFDNLSDFGNLTRFGGGFTWRPVQLLQIIGSYSQEEGPPSIQQLGNPVIITPNVRVFDFVTGQTVEITRIDGGNASLGADRRMVWKLGARLNPIPETDLSFQADYINSRITGPIAGFPTATAEIEAAFPDRFTRDAEGRLTQIDSRPVNFARSHRSELRWGINFSEALEPSKAERERFARARADFERMRKEAEASGKPVPPLPSWMQAQRPGGPGGPPASGAGGGAGGPPPGVARPQGGPGGPPGGGGQGGGRFGEGRLQLSLFHTWRFTDSILIREGVPELDLLNGSAIGSSGGVPRHLLEGRAAVNRFGLGGRISANWQSGTDVLVTPAGPPAPDDLRFSSLTTVNLRLFVDLGQRWFLLRRAPWLRGTRVSIGVDNLFDDRIDVTDRAGTTPINYQPFLVDPVGRRIEVSVRKLFF